MEFIFSGWPLVVISIFLGLTIGSFLNVVIYRTPIVLDRKWRAECLDYLDMEQPEESDKHFSIAWPGSSCPNCSTPIQAWQNIPVISFLLLRGKCAHCSAPISLRYPLFEILTAILTVLVITNFGVGWAGLGALVFTWTLIALAGIDLDTQLLPDNLCLPLLWFGLVLNSGGTFTDLNSALWGAVAGYMSLWIVFWVFKLVTGKEGMGYGDFKLLAALGAWGGWQVLPMIILIASASGLIVAIGMMVFLAHDRRVPIAFGPYLAIGGWLAFMYGPQISAMAPALFPISP